MNDVAVTVETFVGFYRVIKKYLCTWWLQYRSQVHRDFLITLYIFSECSIHDFESYTQRLYIISHS